MLLVLVSQPVATVGLILILASTSACRTPVEPVEPTPAYLPTASMSVDEAKRVIRRSLEEQPPGFAVFDIKISEEKLSFSKDVVRRFIVIPRTTETRPTVFYFDSLGRMDITPKPKGQVVRVWDSHDVFRFRAVIPDPDRARRFMDALLVMSLNVKGDR